MQERVHALLKMRETVAKKQKKIDWVQRLKAFLMNVFSFGNFFHAEGKMYSLGDVAGGWKGYGGDDYKNISWLSRGETWAYLVRRSALEI